MESKEEINSYADANRLRKVLKLIEVFRLGGFNANQAAAMTPDQWRLASICAGVTDPGPITIDLVLVTMRDYEQLSKRTVSAAQARSILGKIEKPKDKKGKRKS